MSYPKGATAVLYRKRCDCDAGASNGRLKVHLNKDKEPFTRSLDLSVEIVELCCDVCELPWRVDVVEVINDADDGSDLFGELTRHIELRAPSRGPDELLPGEDPDSWDA